MSDDGRFVWMTREQRDWVAYVAVSGSLTSLVKTWDAATADPAQAVREALADRNRPRAILRALGKPDPRDAS